MTIIKPPKGTTSTQYHNKAMDHRAEVKRLDKIIKGLTLLRETAHREFGLDIAARDNSRKWENKHKSW